MDALRRAVQRYWGYTMFRPLQIEAMTAAVQGRDLPFAEMNLTRHDLYVADEAFLTGRAAEIIPVTKIDGRPARVCSGTPASPPS